MGFQPFRRAALGQWLAIGLAAVWLSACQDSGVPKELRPVPTSLVAKMNLLDMKETSPIFVRLYKETSELEIWKQQTNGDYALLKTYEICKWSGKLGPKLKEGDRQAPEGVYVVTPAQMNPASHYYLSFNIGYPNTFDRSLGRTGSNLMVHGACSSAGCYSMTDADAGEIFALARDSFRGGQTSFQIQALPFRMTAENLAKHRDDANMPFWRMLKVGSDNFDLTLRPPKIDICDHGYVFNADAGPTFDPNGKCPDYTRPQALVNALAQKQSSDDVAFNAAVVALEAEEKRAADVATSVAAKATGNAATAAKDTAATDATPTAATSAAPKVVANVPMPRLRPEGKAPAATSVSAPAATGTIAPDMTPDIPEVGKFVKKKFVWPGDGEGAAAGTSG
ncbi:MAG: murein L,D-transpeptidase family protein [Bauldia sp.]